MSSNNTSQTYYSSSSYSSYSSTSDGQTTSYREATRTDPSGTSVARESREPGQAPVQERYHVPTSGSGTIEGGATGNTRGRIEDVTDETEADKQYRERMEDEYAKREGGA